MKNSFANKKNTGLGKDAGVLESNVTIKRKI